MKAGSERFTFFWRTEHPFSQWHEAPFTRAGHRFPTAEHWMMWQKACLFGAPAAHRDAILHAATPREAKRLGREVPGFSAAIWAVAAKPIVAEGNYAKFTHNPALLRQLLATAGTTLVEASPTDTVWGIGLTADDPRAQRRATWRGSNWLGEVLTDVRDTLLRARAVQGP